MTVVSAKMGPDTFDTLVVRIAPELNTLIFCFDILVLEGISDFSIGVQVGSTVPVPANNRVDPNPKNAVPFLVDVRN